MRVDTAVHRPIAAIEADPPGLFLDSQDARWKRRHLLSSFSDRRTLREIGGMGAYLTQVRWSLWWALRR